MNEKYKIRITRLAVLPDGEPLYSMRCTEVSLVGEAAGEFIEIKQASENSDVESLTIGVMPEEWPALKEAVERLLAEIKAHEIVVEYKHVCGVNMALDGTCFICGKNLNQQP